MVTATPTVLRSLLRIPIELVEPGANARGDLGDLSELRRSIAAIGIQQPLLVQELQPGRRYQILEGHRRYAVAKQLGLPHVIALLRRVDSDSQRLLLQLAIHNQRRSFDPIAEARALETLMFDHKMTREEIAEAIGKSDGWVRDRMGLLTLSDSEKAAVSSGELPIRNAINMVHGRRGAFIPGHTHAPAPTACRKGAVNYNRNNREEPHLNKRHPLAKAAAERCDHGHRPHIGMIACGECWEAVIRDDVIRGLQRDATKQVAA